MFKKNIIASVVAVLIFAFFIMAGAIPLSADNITEQVESESTEYRESTEYKEYEFNKCRTDTISVLTEDKNVNKNEIIFTYSNYRAGVMQDLSAPIIGYYDNYTFLKDYEPPKPEPEPKEEFDLKQYIHDNYLVDPKYKYYTAIDTDGKSYTLPKEIQEYMYDKCEEYGITDYYNTIMGQCFHESNFDNNAVSSTHDHGYMQINYKNFDYFEELGFGDVTEPYNNINAGVWLMAEYIHKYGDVCIALACYNMGEERGKHYNSTPYVRAVLKAKEKLVSWN